jgi:tetratricopeptide (TPR) repeat protein
LKDGGRLQEHLDNCPDCRDLLKDFQSIVEQAKGLPKHEPSNRVWTGILSGVCDVRDDRVAGPSPSPIKLPKPRWVETYVYSRPARFAWAAAALLLLVAGGLVIGLRPARDLNGLSEQDRFTLAKLEEAEKHYKLAIQALSEAVKAQPKSFDPLVIAVFARNISEIDTAIQACQAAVTNNPNDLSAREYLLGAYKDKVDFLDNLIDVRKTPPAAKPAGKKI